MKQNEFYVGQRVKQKDPDDGTMVYGHIVEIKDKSIIVDWNDMKGVEHFEDEYDSIKDGNPGK